MVCLTSVEIQMRTYLSTGFRRGVLMCNHNRAVIECALVVVNAPSVWGPVPPFSEWPNARRNHPHHRLLLAIKNDWPAAVNLSLAQNVPLSSPQDCGARRSWKHVASRCGRRAGCGAARGRCAVNTQVIELTLSHLSVWTGAALRTTHCAQTKSYA